MKIITVVGAGRVGATVAQLIGAYRLGRVYLMDIKGEKARGITIDLSQAGYDIEYTEAYKQSDIVVIAAGFSRKPNMGRNGLYEDNSKVVKDILKKCVKVSPDAIYIFVTNPVDKIAKLGFKYGLWEDQIKAMGNELDSMRFRYFIKDMAERDGISVYSVAGEVRGEHSIKMDVLVEKAAVNNMLITSLFNQSQLLEIVDNTKKAGDELIKLCKGSVYAPAEGVIQIIRRLV